MAAQGSCIWLAWLILLAGCGGVEYARRLDDPTVRTSKVVVVDRAARESILAAATRIERNDEGKLEADISLKNDSNKACVLEYQVKYKDRAGGIASETDWQRQELPAGAEVKIPIIATSDTIHDFVVLLRTSK